MNRRRHARRTQDSRANPRHASIDLSLSPTGTFAPTPWARHRFHEADARQVTDTPRGACPLGQIILTAVLFLLGSCTAPSERPTLELLEQANVSPCSKCDQENAWHVHLELRVTDSSEIVIGCPWPRLHHHRSCYLLCSMKPDLAYVVVTPAACCSTSALESCNNLRCQL